MKSSTKKALKKFAKQSYENVKEAAVEVGSSTYQGVKKAFTPEEITKSGQKKILQAQRDRLEVLKLQKEIMELRRQAGQGPTPTSPAQRFAEGSSSKINEAFGVNRTKRVNQKAIPRLKQTTLIPREKILELGWGGF